MSRQASSPQPVAIVLGCGDVGSAVALALHQARLCRRAGRRGRSGLAPARYGVHQCVVCRQRRARGRGGVLLCVAEEHSFHSRATDDRRDDVVLAGRGRRAAIRPCWSMRVGAGAAVRRSCAATFRSRSASVPALSTARTSTWRWSFPRSFDGGSGGRRRTRRCGGRHLARRRRVQRDLHGRSPEARPVHHRAPNRRVRARRPDRRRVRQRGHQGAGQWRPPWARRARRPHRARRHAGRGRWRRHRPPLLWRRRGPAPRRVASAMRARGTPEQTSNRD